MCDICESVSRILFLSLGLNYLEIILTFVSLIVSLSGFHVRIIQALFRSVPSSSVF